MNKKEFIAYYSQLPETQFEMAKKWAEELFFMEKTLKKLRKKINEEGSIVEKMTGNGFKVEAENPAQTSYNIMIRNYNATLKHLTDLRPDADEEDALSKYLREKAELRAK